MEKPGEREKMVSVATGGQGEDGLMMRRVGNGGSKYLKKAAA